MQIRDERDVYLSRIYMWRTQWYVKLIGGKCFDLKLSCDRLMGQLLYIDTIDGGMLPKLI